MDELNESIQEELRSAVGALAVGKAPAKDGIPSDVFKCAKGTLLHKLHEIICLCAGGKAMYHKTREMPTSSLSTRTRLTGL